MNKPTIFLISVSCLAFFTAFIIETGSGTAVQTKPIPDDVQMVIKKSCINCHAEPGKKLALAHVNLSKWQSYTAEKQAAKSKDMCRMISKGKMPPKSFREKNPDFVVTKDDIKTICDWSASLQQK